jgi:hypothetical protein
VADVPGKECGGGAHPSSGTSVERWGGTAWWRLAVVELARWSLIVVACPCSLEEEGNE